MIKPNPNNPWKNTPSLEKRVNGFLSYCLSAFTSLIYPEHTDRAVYRVLSRQFIDDETVPAEEYKKLEKQFSDFMAGRATIEEIAVENGAITAVAGSELVRVMAAQFAALLNSSGAKNYLEMVFTPRGGSELGEVIVTLQRRDGKTPHQIRQQLELDIVSVCDQLGIHVNKFPQGTMDKIAVLKHLAIEFAAYGECCCDLKTLTICDYCLATAIAKSTPWHPDTDDGPLEAAQQAEIDRLNNEKK
jgi:hypothetical protein